MLERYLVSIRRLYALLPALLHNLHGVRLSLRRFVVLRLYCLMFVLHQLYSLCERDRLQVSLLA